MSIFNNDNNSFGLKIYNNEKAYKILNQLVLFASEIRDYDCKSTYTSGSYDGINNFAYLKVFADKFIVSIDCNGEIVLTENSEDFVTEKLLNCIDVICPENSDYLKNKLRPLRIKFQYYSNWGRGRSVFNKMNASEANMRKTLANLIKLFAQVSFRANLKVLSTYSYFKENWSYNNTNQFIPYNKHYTVEGITYQDLYLLYLTFSGKRTQYKKEIKNFVGVEDDIVISSLRKSIMSDIQNKQEMILKEVSEEVEKLHVELFELTKQKYIDTLKKFKSNTDIFKSKFSKDISDIGYSSPMLDKTLSNAINQLISYEKDKMIGTFASALGYDSKFGRNYFFTNAKNFS